MDSKDQPPRLLWRDHMSLVLTGVFFTMFLTKVTAVAHGDPTTSLAILARTTPATALFGIVALVGLWFGIGLAGSFVVAEVVKDLGQDDRRGRAHAAITGYGTMIALLVSALVGLVIIALGNGWILYRWQKPKVAPAVGTRFRSRYYLMGAGWVITLSLVASDQMWLPPEALSLESGGVKVGYVLEENQDGFVFLHENSRTVERIATASIRSRAYCRFGGSSHWSLRPAQALRRSSVPAYNTCPTSRGLA